MKIRIHAIIKGRVQGVFFRQNTLGMANKLNITGWCRNLNNGDVEVTAEGQNDNIEKFVEFLRSGSENAVVENLEINEEEFKSEFSSFEIVQ